LEVGIVGTLTDEEKAVAVPAVEQPHAGAAARLMINSQMLDQPVRWSDVVQVKSCSSSTGHARDRSEEACGNARDGGARGRPTKQKMESTTHIDQKKTPRNNVHDNHYTVIFT
jgi:hypothetical protein